MTFKDRVPLLEIEEGMDPLTKIQFQKINEYRLAYADRLIRQDKVRKITKKVLKHCFKLLLYLGAAAVGYVLG